VDAGRTVDFAREAPATDSACPAYLVDGPGLPMTLIFWRNSEFPPTSVASRVTSDRARVIVLAQQSGALLWLAHTAAVAPPPSLVPGPQPGCGLPDDATSVAWSTPLPPAQGLHTLVHIAEAPDGCLGLDLQHDTGLRRWHLCVPLATFPFLIGEKVSIGPVTKDQAFGALDGVVVTDGKGRTITAGKGGHVVYLGGVRASLAAVKGCDGTFDKCGAFATRLAVTVDGVEIAPGQAKVIGKGRTLHLVRAQQQVTADPSYLPGLATTGAGPYVESVLVEE
jgi:hypothetical protein